ncbi:MAG: citrate lyase holo-[acyl-carrier protein] synthase [Christensenellales bacterium]
MEGKTMAERVTVPDMMNAREARAQAQRTLLARYPGAAVVCLCMNIAGPVKRTENIERAFAWGAAQVKAVLAPYETLFDAAIHEKTGPEAMICVRAEAEAVKKRLCALEDGEELGRLLDIDVIAPDGARSRGRRSACPRGAVCLRQPAPVCAKAARTRTRC